MKLKLQVGNPLTPKEKGPKLIAHVVNDYGNWGSNRAAALIGTRWKTVPLVYQERFYDAKGLSLGQVQFKPVTMDCVVANMVAQHGVSKGGDIFVDPQAFVDCLEVLKVKARNTGASVCFVLSGLPTRHVEDALKVIETMFSDFQKDVAVYAETTYEARPVADFFTEPEAPVVEDTPVEAPEAVAEAPVDTPVPVAEAPAAAPEPSAEVVPDVAPVETPVEKPVEAQNEGEKVETSGDTKPVSAPAAPEDVADAGGSPAAADTGAVEASPATPEVQSVTKTGD